MNLRRQKSSLLTFLFVFSIMTCFAQSDRKIQYTEITFENVNLNESEKQALNEDLLSLLQKVVAKYNYEITNATSSNGQYQLSVNMYTSNKVEDATLPTEAYFLDIAILSGGETSNTLGFYKTIDALKSSMTITDEFQVLSLRSFFEKQLEL